MMGLFVQLRFMKGPEFDSKIVVLFEQDESYPRFSFETW